MTAALSDAYRQVRGEEIPDRILALLLALSDYETATFKKIFHHNLGNIVVTSESQPYFHLNGRDGKPTVHRYRIYDTLEDGAVGYVSQLLSPTRPQWAEGLLSGDPVFFVDSLSGLHGGARYHETDPDQYRRTFLGRYAKYEPAFTTPDAEAAEPGFRESSSQTNVFAWMFAASAGLLGMRMLLKGRRS